MRMYIGKVAKNVDNGSLVEFTINDYYESSSNRFVAAPMSRLTKYPQQGDELFIIQPDEGIHLFYYVQCHDTDNDSTGATDKVSMSFDKTEISIDKSGNVSISANGNVDIKGKSVNIDCDNSFSLKVGGRKRIEGTAKGVSLKGTMVQLEGAIPTSGFAIGEPGAVACIGVVQANALTVI